MKSAILRKLTYLNQLQRELEDLAIELKIGDISEDKIVIAIKAYRNSLENLLEEDDD